MEKEYYSKGKRSIVYKSSLNGKTVAIKEERKDIDAIERINNEIKWLKRLNKKGIGPKLIDQGENYMICEFVEGKRILDFFREENPKKIKKIILEVLEQCRTMDKMLVNKEEMHHPIKHIIIGKNVTMIDFERCHSTERPKNVTQFCQFLISKKVTDILKNKGIAFNKDKIKQRMKKYKKDYSEENYNQLKKLIA